MRKIKKMCIEWKDNKAIIDKSGDLLLARRSLETSPSEVLLEDGYLESGVFHYYIRDHLGNNRVVASSGGSIIQKNYYYPFGMSYADDVAPTKQPYKYNGKKLDPMNGLNQYDYSARFHDPAIGRFTTMYPLAEKYYSVSPYAYCLNNPIRYVDPTGMDVWQLDENGRLIKTITHDADGNRLTYDRIEVHNEKGKVLGQTSDYELGTITYSEETVGEGDKAWSYDKFTVNGTENATSIFQTVADHTRVEWSHGAFGKEGGPVSNFITTTHNERNEGGMRQVQLEQNIAGNPMLEHTHSHPKHHGETGTYPSGLPGSGETGDIQFAEQVIKYYNVTPIFKIYVPFTKKTITYGPNSVRSDF